MRISTVDHEPEEVTWSRMSCGTIVAGQAACGITDYTV